MKMRFLISFGLLASLFCLPSARAFQPVDPGHAPLPNYDKRKSNAPPAADSNQGRASVSLRTELPGLKFDRDARTGTPRFLSAGRGFLTAAGGRAKSAGHSQNSIVSTDAKEVTKAFVNEHSALFGHDATAFDDANVKTDAVTPHSGMRTVIWQQALDEIPVYGGLFVSHATKNNELISVSDRFVPDLKRAGSKIPGRAQFVKKPTLSVRSAIAAAAANLGDSLAEETLQETDEAPEGAILRQSWQSPRLRGPAHAQLVWLPTGADTLELCWQVILTTRVRPEMYLVLVSAKTGEIQLRRCLTSYISDASYRVYTSDSPTPFSPGFSAPSGSQPTEVPRTLVTLKALNTNASPAGWIDDGGNETRGNNVDAHLDRNDDDLPDLPRPQGNPNRMFDFPLDLSQPPAAYGDAAVVNLFYWNNFMHDKLYELGFTEAFWNFQGTNFGRGGKGKDAVLADAQDGGGFNNANFATPPDGFPGRMQMYLFDGPNPDRDGDLDAEVMCHEYTHGLSNRLLGGDVGISNLQPAGMGEGWSDFYGLSLLSEPTDDPNGVYASGGYASHKIFGLNQNYYFGIRRYPYCTDMSKNPLTLKDIDPTQADPHAGIPVSPIFGGSPADEVHAMGEVWCMVLWEARANLIEKLGGDAGNHMMLQLVTDGLKLAPENASFLEARDGILLADEVLTGGDNLSELWFAFAKRGMGLSAVVPPSDTGSTIGVIEAYDVPDYVNNGVPDGVLEVKISPASGSALFGGSTNFITVRVTDGLSVTNAVIDASFSTGDVLVFHNDGVDPDLTANNAIYSATYVAPNVTTNVTLTLVISAPDKETSTNVFSYSIIPIPANDNFASATKVAASGGNYITSNKRATTETGEPAHAGVASAAASLWWNFTPTNNATVLVDTPGSLANTIVAIYTNSTLATLGLVTSANDIGARQQAFVMLNGRAGVTYRIAVASYDTNSTGTIRLAITPGGVPDTNAPSLTVSSPPSGLTVGTNRVFITGTAIDPDPNPSGLQEIQIRINRGLGQTKTETGGVSGGTTTSSLISSNWTRSVGLFEGLNLVEVTVKDVAGNVSTPVNLQIIYRPLDPPNDFFVNAITLSGLSDTNSVNTLKATKEVGEPIHAGNPGGKSAWWKYQPPEDGFLTLSTTNSTFDTLLAVYTGNAVNALSLVAENDDAFEGITGGTSELGLAVRSNQTYRIAVDGYDAAGGVVFLSHSLAPAKVFRLTVNGLAGGTTFPGSMDVRSNDTASITAIPLPGYTFDMWDGDVTSFANPVSVLVNRDKSITARFRPVMFSDGFESGDFTGLGWTGGGSAPWIVQTNVSSGGFAARSGVINNGQTSSLILNSMFRAGNVTFDFRVSSELGWDILGVYLDGVLQQQWSGELGWSSYSYPITAGAHTLEWRYSKDPNNSVGQDAAFIDNVTLPIFVAPNGSTPAHLQFRRLTDGTGYVDVTGQTNQQYIIQVSTNLTSWESVSTNVAFGGFFRYVDPSPVTPATRFYRAVVLTP